MKNILFATIMVISFLASVIHVNAQERTPATPEERATKITEWMKINLLLSNEQTPKVSDINLRYAKINETIKNSSPDSLDKRQKIKALKSSDKAKEGELKKVLNEDQFKAYLKKKEELKKLLKEEMKKRKQ